MKTLKVFGLILVVLFTGSIIVDGTAKAEEPKYPSQPITIIVAYPAGGGGDLSTRLLAEYANKYIQGENFIVKNIVGGGGMVGNIEISKARPDGYTLGAIGPVHVTDEHLIKGCPYTKDNFVPLVMVAADPHVLVIKKDLKFSFEQYIEYVRKTPERSPMAIGGTWNSPDFFRVKLERAIGSKFLRVPFQGGAPALQAVAAGNVDSSPPFIAEALPLIEARLVTPIAVSNTERSPLLPDVPTFKEMGYDAVQTLWRGLSVPPGTPKAIIDYLELVFKKTYDDPAFIEKMKKAGFNPTWKGHKEFVEFYGKEALTYRQLIQELGIEPK